MRKLKLIGGAIVLALAMLITTQIVLASTGTVEVLHRDGTNVPWGTFTSERIVAGDTWIISEVEGDYSPICGPDRGEFTDCDIPDHIPDDRQIRGCSAPDSGYILSRIYVQSRDTWEEPEYISELGMYCSASFDADYSQVIHLYFEEEPTAWSLGVEGAFTTTQMQGFLESDPYSEGGNDFIPNSGEWVTTMLDYALSWLQTINQDDFLFFLMAFGLVNYIISWLWRQLSGASVMGEAEAWRGMFDADEE